MRLPRSPGTIVRQAAFAATRTNKRIAEKPWHHSVAGQSSLERTYRASQKPSPPATEEALSYSLTAIIEVLMRLEWFVKLLEELVVCC